MENKGLIFIPDISGFSRFVSETEIEHSRLIIQELLEILIDANDMGLEISEIEGDAILFYKFGDPPDLHALYRQVEKMFRAFHQNLIAYDHRRYCQCKACMAAVGLTLKVITHYGEFTGYKVRNFHKLIGRDLIVAHHLLKNNIEHHEYWLITKSLLPGNPPDFATWMSWESSRQQMDAGEIAFRYTRLTGLRSEVKPEPSSGLEMENKVKVVTATQLYDTDMITLFHATGDFRYRSRWQEGVKAMEEVGHFLPRVGMKCRCIMESGEHVLYASSYHYQPDKIVFSETAEKKSTVTYYTLEKAGPGKTKLTIDYCLDERVSGSLHNEEKQRIQDRLTRSLDKLTDFIKELRIPGADAFCN
ncbi:MAG TPA: DUF2652 domain-containing protein [Ohtaekwangia sp.]|nr:DUF2652 domain-containing protein [Ohtaekwangia sp.]